MYIKRLAENFVQKAFLIFELYSFEVDCHLVLIFFFLAHSLVVNFTAFLLQ
jgi:hypothetical protein